MKDDNFAGRIDGAIKRIGNIGNACAAAGITYPTISRWKDGSSDPKLSNIKALADAAAVNLEWLATGEGPMAKQARTSDGTLLQESAGVYDIDPDAARNQHATIHGDDGKIQSIAIQEYVVVPSYDVRTLAENEAVVEQEQRTGALIFRRQWICQELRANPSDLCLIDVDGESMEPTLRTGDMILLDRRKARVVPCDGIYVLRMRESLIVKRLQKLPGNKAKVTSDNPAYGEFFLSLDAQNEELSIIGRVVWSGRRM